MTGEQIALPFDAEGATRLGEALIAPSVEVPKVALSGNGAPLH